MKRSLIWRYGLTMGIVAAVGCATAPRERTEDPAPTIRSAEEIGAQKIPQAALHLQLAKEQAQQAKLLMAKGGDENAADLLFARAQADAELARVLAREASTRTEAQQAVEKVNVLKQSNQVR